MVTKYLEYNENMKPIEFKEQTHILAKDQPEYQPLPVLIEADGCMTSCWKLSIWERLKLLFTGRLWLMQLTFHQPLQPQLPSVNNPIIQLLPEQGNLFITTK